MKPRQFLQQIGKGAFAPGYLFLGNELFSRDRCRRELVRGFLGAANEAGGPLEGLVEFDLGEQPLRRVIDEARTLSLFASKRLIVGLRAEAALPKRVTSGDSGPGALLREYFASPAPGVVMLFEATRHDWNERDEKAKLERAAKFYSDVPASVELTRFTPREALAAATELARELKLEMERPVMAELVDLLGSDMARLANDLEKLSLYAADGRAITSAEIELLIPEARQRGVYEFSDALARKDLSRALDILDTLAKRGEYWPMQINLLAGLFRQALAVKEQKVRSVAEVTRVFNRTGIRIWPARARQILDIARRFSQPQLEGALSALFQADRDLRRERPDDRLIMEQLVMRLVA